MGAKYAAKQDKVGYFENFDTGDSTMQCYSKGISTYI